MKPNIACPIKKAEKGKTKAYCLIVTDANNVVHYFDRDGRYDGYSSDPHIDGGSGSCLN